MMTTKAEVTAKFMTVFNKLHDDGDDDDEEPPVSKKAKTSEAVAVLGSDESV